MKEYIDKSALIAEMESLRCSTFTDFGEGFNAAVQAILEVIDTLEVKEIQEEPVNEDLEEAAKNHAVERYRVTRDRELAEKCKWSFKTGAKWQKQQMMRGAVETHFNVGLPESVWRKLKDIGVKDGDKLLIIKE